MTTFILCLVCSVISAYFAYGGGYRVGWDDCDEEYDFERCPHCNEFLVQGEEDATSQS